LNNYISSSSTTTRVNNLAVSIQEDKSDESKTATIEGEVPDGEAAPV